MADHVAIYDKSSISEPLLGTNNTLDQIEHFANLDPVQIKRNQVKLCLLGRASTLVLD